MPDSLAIFGMRYDMGVANVGGRMDPRHADTSYVGGEYAQNGSA